MKYFMSAARDSVVKFSTAAVMPSLISLACPVPLYVGGCH
jgi:hypothetical protein